MKNDFSKQIVNNLYLLYRNQHPLLSQDLSEQTIEKVFYQRVKIL